MLLDTDSIKRIYDNDNKKSEFYSKEINIVYQRKMLKSQTFEANRYFTHFEITHTHPNIRTRGRIRGPENFSIS